MVICCCSLCLQDCLLLPFVQCCPLFLMGECVRLLSAHMTPRGHIGVHCSFSKHTSVLQSGGSCCNGSPLNAQQPNNSRIWLRGRQANTLQMALLFTCLSSPPPTSFIYWDPRWHFQEPHGNSRPCQGGTTFS